MKVFIASSNKSVDYVHQLKIEFQNIAKRKGTSCVIKVWNQTDVFPNGTTTIDELIQASKSYDFGVFFFYDDDIIIKDKGTDFLLNLRKGGISPSELNNLKLKTIAKDNVVFEYGLFVSSIGIKRCFIVNPSSGDFKIPSDIHGLITNRYAKTSSNDISSDEISSIASTKLKIRLDLV